MPIYGQMTHNKTYKIHTQIDDFTLNTDATATNVSTKVAPEDIKEGVSFFGTTSSRTGLSGYLEISNDGITFYRSEVAILFGVHNDFAINTASYKARYYRVRFTTTNNANSVIKIHTSFH